MRCLFNLIFTATLHIFSLNTFAQSSIKPEPSSSFTQTYFQNELKEDAHLYTGKEYYRYTAGVKGYPFYITDQMQPGEILYDGTIYKDVPMLFDAVRQVVVINQYQQDNRIQLLTEKINYFILNGHRFETFLQAEGTENAVSKGLYDVLYAGSASVLIKRIKKIKSGLRAEDPTSFKEEDEIYIRNGKSLYKINNKNGVMAALENKKDLIKTFIRKNRLRFKKHIEQDVAAVATYYSTLN